MKFNLGQVFEEMIEFIENETDFSGRYYDDLKILEFQIYTPTDGDFIVEIVDPRDVGDVVRDIFDYYDNFDVSEETYIWLDDSGHGVNGAPYDMKDLYEDMEWRKEQLWDLSMCIKRCSEVI